MTFAFVVVGFYNELFLAPPSANGVIVVIGVVWGGSGLGVCVCVDSGTRNFSHKRSCIALHLRAPILCCIALHCIFEPLRRTGFPQSFAPSFLTCGDSHVSRTKGVVLLEPWRPFQKQEGVGGK